MTFLRALHRWIGLALAAVVGAVAVSGGLLLLRDPYYRRAYPVVDTPISTGERALRAEVLQGIEQRWQAEGVRLVRFPREGVNAYQVWLGDGTEAFVEPRTGAVIDRWRWSERLPAFLFELHAHLLVRPAGEVVNGVIALAIVFMGLTGVVARSASAGPCPAAPPPASCCVPTPPSARSRSCPSWSSPAPGPSSSSTSRRPG